MATRLRKLRTVSGAVSGNISISISPASVSSLTHCAAIFSTVAPSNGSRTTVSTAGRSFFFGGAALLFCGPWACADASDTRAASHANEAIDRFRKLIIIISLFYHTSNRYRSSTSTQPDAIEDEVAYALALVALVPAIQVGEVRLIARPGDDVRERPAGGALPVEGLDVVQIEAQLITNLFRRDRLQIRRQSAVDAFLTEEPDAVLEVVVGHRFEKAPLARAGIIELLIEALFVLGERDAGEDAHVQGPEHRLRRERRQIVRMYDVRRENPLTLSVGRQRRSVSRQFRRPPGNRHRVVSEHIVIAQNIGRHLRLDHAPAERDERDDEQYPRRKLTTARFTSNAPAPEKPHRQHQ